MYLNLHPQSTQQTSLRPLFEDYLRSALWSEERLMPFYQRMAEQLGSKGLIDLVQDHLGATTQQFRRLLEIFESIGLKAESRRFDVVEKHLKRLENLLQQIESGPVRDAAVIAELQQIIHCEIAVYGTLRSFAISLKEERVVWLLEESLGEEKSFDSKLSFLALAHVNDEAANSEY